jgi:hypothetical protein
MRSEKPDEIRLKNDPRGFAEGANDDETAFASKISDKKSFATSKTTSRDASRTLARASRRLFCLSTQDFCPLRTFATPRASFARPVQAIVPTGLRL